VPRLPDIRSGDLHRESSQAVGTHVRSAQAGGLQYLQSRELPGSRDHNLRRRRYAGSHFRPVRRRRGRGSQRDSGVRKHRPAADVPITGAVHLLSSAFAKSIAAFADKLKPTTERLTPINFSFERSLDRVIEGKIYRL